MDLKIFYIFLLTACIAVMPSGAAGEESADSGPVTIKADSVSQEAATGNYSASGNVEIKWDAAILTADKALVNDRSGVATAEGNVRLVKDDDILTANRLQLDLENEEGELTDAELFVKKSNLHVKGGKIAKTGDEQYRLERGSFTTCDGDTPSWKFSASQLDLTVEGYAVARNALFYIRDWPVFYTPFLIFPAKTERQSGFLFPRIGSSTKKGFYLDLPFYWVLSASQDLTFDLDIQTKRGVGTGADYRYIRRHGSEGEFRGYGIYDTSQSRFRGEIEGKHLELQDSGVAARADINMVTDREFYNDFGVATGIYNRQFVESSVSVTKNWEDASLVGQLRYVQDLEAANDRLTLQRLPTISYSLLGRRLGKFPAFFSVDSSFLNVYREEGQQGQRFDLRPELRMYTPVPGGGLSLWGGYRQRFYEASRDDTGGGARGAGLADAGAAVTSSLDRVYGLSWGGMERVKHTLTPEIGYRFVEEKNQESLPFFDYGDRIPGHSMMVWGVSNYLTGRSPGEGNAPEYRELLYLRLSQSYLLSGQRRDLLTLTDPGRPFSDIRLEGRINPFKMLSFSTDSRFDTYGFRFSTASIYGDLTDKSGNFGGLGYRISRGVVEYAEARLGLNLVKPFVFNYTGRYSFDRDDFLEALYSIEYKQQCWSLLFSFRDRPDNREFLVSFTLSGIGPVGPVRAF